MGVVVELRSKAAFGNISRGERSTPPAGEIDTALRELARRCWAWEALPLARRVELLDEVIAGTAAVAPGWVARECERKQLSWGSAVAGEEWWNGSWRALRAAHGLRAELTKRGQEDRARGRVRIATVHRNDTVSSIPFIETIETLFGEGQVVLLQLSTRSLAPVLDKALHPVIDEGFVRIVTGGPVTDSGSVTPVIVVPGDWSAADFARQARAIATMLTHGGSYERGAVRLLVTDRGWRGRERLLAALRRVLQGVPNRFAFHPGAHGRFARFMQAHPEIELLGAGHSGSLPWGLITNLDPCREDLAFTMDPFAPILSETSLQSSSIADFIDGAVAFCNERVAGRLVATLIADPRGSRDPSTAAALERGTERLGYQMVTINLPPFVGLVYGHKGREAARHGKTVIRGAFRSITTPPWLVTHSHSHDVFRRLARYEVAPSTTQLPAIIWHSIRG
ncbi:MAG TPA: hypothetical protein VEF89_02115 [Solirubrobacteraceae bacterium]|nr:hypothetical protein [Solirubrobacteraceae bacterium]